MIVDVHGHITPPELLERFPMPRSLGDVTGMLDAKSAAGIDVTIVGSPVGFGTMMPVPGAPGDHQDPDDLRRFHAWLAETVSRHEGRLAAYAYADPFGGDQLLEIAASAVRGGGFAGLIVNSSVRGEYLDSPRAEPFFAMAAELGVPVLVHPPAKPVGHESFRDFKLVEQVARWNDVAAGLAAIVLGGWLERMPGLTIIGATAGGGLPLLVEKLDIAYRPAHWEGSGAPPGPPASRGPGGAPAYEPLPSPPSTYLERLYVDTATPSSTHLRAALEVFGADHLLFATDSPPMSVGLDQALQAIRDLPVDDRERDAILGGNAARVFRLD